MGTTQPELFGSVSPPELLHIIAQVDSTSVRDVGGAFGGDSKDIAVQPVRLVPSKYDVTTPNDHIASVGTIEMVVESQLARNVSLPDTLHCDGRKLPVWNSVYGFDKNLEHRDVRIRLSYHAPLSLDINNASRF